jgi:hypothetical protein
VYPPHSDGGALAVSGIRADDGRIVSMGLWIPATLRRPAGMTHGELRNDAAARGSEGPQEMDYKKSDKI